jgi:hypothetical protein
MLAGGNTVRAIRHSPSFIHINPPTPTSSDNRARFIFIFVFASLSTCRPCAYSPINSARKGFVRFVQSFSSRTNCLRTYRGVSSHAIGANSDTCSRTLQPVNEGVRTALRYDTAVVSALRPSWVPTCPCISISVAPRLYIPRWPPSFFFLPSRKLCPAVPYVRHLFCA